MSRKYQDFVAAIASIEDKEKRIEELRNFRKITTAHEIYKKGFCMGVTFSIISVLVILGVVYLGTYYEFIF